MSRANGRSALMVAAAVLLSVAVLAPAVADELNTPVFVSPAANGAQPNTAAEPSTGAQPTGQNPVNDPNQLNEIDRASPAGAAAEPTPPTAGGDAPASIAAAAPASSGHSVWSDTSLIGKIFIGFGALLTIASAARMFMA